MKSGMMKIPRVKLPDIISLAFETNGKGYLGFMVELPGAFVRGRTEEEAIAKVKREVDSYGKWLKMENEHDFAIRTEQTHRSLLAVEDADCEILLDADKMALDDDEFKNLTDLAWFSGVTFSRLYDNARFKDWVDESRIRRTFYGDNPKTIQEIFDHVKQCQYYYLSRLKIMEKIDGDFMAIRKFGIEKLKNLYRGNKNSLIFDIENELWTLKKVLRRFV